MKSINYYSKQITYSIKGKGTTLVFLHGFGESSLMWDGYLDKFDDYQTVTIDFPGAGSSQSMDCSIARLAKIVNAVLKAEAIEKCILIGHSLGGYVTLAFAKMYEEKLLGYTLFHSQPYADTAEKKENRNKSIDFVKKHGHALYFKGLIPKLFDEKFLKSNSFTIDKMTHIASQMPTEGVIHQLEAMRDRPDTTAVLEGANVPVLFIIGKEDVAVPAQNSLNQTYLPKVADIHILPKVGHMGMYEAKQQTTKIIRRFINFCVENI